MADINELFQELEKHIASGELTREEAARRLSGTIVEPKHQWHFSINKVLYIIGAIVVIIGIVIFVGQIWEDIGSAGRILVTLGLGLLITGLGSLLLRRKPDDAIGSVFHLIGGVLIPSGALVTLYELSNDVYNPWALVYAWIGISIFYVLLMLAHRKPLLTFFTIVHATTLCYLVFNAMKIDDGATYAYLTMLIATAFLLLPLKFRSTWNEPLNKFMYFFGSAGFLSAAFSRAVDSQVWEIIFFAIVIAGLFLAAQLKSRSVLAMSALFLVIHTSYITDQYFADSLGWPISLVILGFLFIGLGYITLNINRRYIKAQNPASS